jgi:23S rRNA (pseudouridine1915-N3)-methyltransferase
MVFPVFGNNLFFPMLCCILLSMRVTLAHIASRASSKDTYEELIRSYLNRCAGFMQSEAKSFRSEEAFLDWLGRQHGRTQTAVLLLDGRGKQMSSEALAAWVGKHRDEGTQQIVFAIGPADGWSEAARELAKGRGGLLSLGTMTLAHQLARLVMAEQIYRAYTILTGHPYHRGS